MPEAFVDSLLALLSSVIGFEIATTEFSIVAGVALVFLLVFAKLISGLFGSESGFIKTFFAVLAPVLIAACAYAAVEVYLLPRVEAEWALPYLSWAGFGLVFLLIALGFSTQMWDLGIFGTLGVFIFSIAIALGAGYAAHQIINLVDTASTQIEKRDGPVSKETLP